MPAKSKAQQKAAGAALAAKRGETPVSKLKGASKSMYESISEKQLDEFASTKRKGKPEHVSKKRELTSAPHLLAEAQSCNVRLWHLADMGVDAEHVRSQG